MDRFVFDAKLSTAVEGKAAVAAGKPAAGAAAGSGTHVVAPGAAVESGPLSQETLARMQKYWQAANYLTVGQIYLQENPLLRQPLTAAHIKPRLLGHWGTSTGQNFIYVHLNRLIQEKEVNAIYISGPGHGGPALIASSYLEGTYTDVHPDVTQDLAGLRTLFRQFSTPGGVSSHCGPHVPGSINEGGELGYSLVHAYGAAFDNPDLLVVCVIGDGEAETGPLEGSWKSNKFLNPARDGTVLPILHLNGYKISGPTVNARVEDRELQMLFEGRGYAPHFVEGDEPAEMHRQFAATLDRCYGEIQAIQRAARAQGPRNVGAAGPCWPAIILRSPKGWTGPKEVDGLPIEGTFRAHQVPLADVRQNPARLKMLETWMRSYCPEELFDEEGRFRREWAALAPEGDRRLSANPHANGGRLLVQLALPEFTGYALEVPAPGKVLAEAPRKLGEFLRDAMKQNPRNFRFFCPDETESNRLSSVLEATPRCSEEITVSIDDRVGSEGRVMEVLSEHCTEGWLEGYLLTGRHGVWSSYEGFAQIVDSMITQHAKWLEQSREFGWRRSIASLNIFLTSHAWRNDHNGFSHQAPGFVDNALQRRKEVIRVYFPPDANCLLSVMDHCLRSRDYINLVTCGKQFALQWLTMAEAMQHCSQGASIWKFAGNDAGGNPDVVLACAGDVPTMETVAASWLLQKYVPGIRVRVVNIVDLCTLIGADEHTHGMDNIAFESLFTREAPVVFAYHSYPAVIHSMMHGRPNEARFHVRGFLDRGTTTTPFDMVVLNQMSRYHLAQTALRYVPRLQSQAADVRDLFERKLYEHHVYIREHFEDMPEIANWVWTADFSEPIGPPALAVGQPREGTFTNS